MRDAGDLVVEIRHIGAIAVEERGRRQDIEGDGSC